MNDPYKTLVKLYQKLLDTAQKEKNKYLAMLMYLIVILVLVIVLIALVIQKLSGI